MTAIQDAPGGQDDGFSLAGRQVAPSEHAVLPDAPERPRLASGVALVGELQGSGFADRQWLVQRDGQFIQVTELLYRILEHCDGRRSTDAIAQAVTDATEWAVTCEHVQLLLVQKLTPLRLISSAQSPIVNARQGGNATQRSQSRALSSEPLNAESTSQSTWKKRSPLALTLHIQLLRAEAIEPLSAALAILFAPPVIATTLLLIAITQIWVYHVRGLGAALTAVLLHPILMLPILLITLLGTVFHEFGHAAALHVGGGRARSMGAGIYLIYPALYTDVTDSYRLGRWARVRTDLGGFYFSLLYAALLTALSLITGQAFLLIVVFLIDVDILYQCLPFVRLDGYWACADLTGIPDLFSFMAPFARSLVPGTAFAGSRLPPLKPWVKGVFLLYILLAVPVLTLLAFLTILQAPAFLLQTWSAVEMQLRALAGSWRDGGPASIALTLVQLLLLAITMVGFIFLLYGVSRPPVATLFHWSRSTPSRRLAGAAFGVVAVLLVAYLWAPQVPYTGYMSVLGVRSVAQTSPEPHVGVLPGDPSPPPVAGAHGPEWQTCGFYPAPVTNDAAVSSLERGVVWITYRPDLPTAQVQQLRELARRQSDVLVSPYLRLPAPLAASAWGHQLLLQSPDDPRLGLFLHVYALNPQAPRAGQPCAGGIGPTS